jgi:hypothetical protein
MLYIPNKVARVDGPWRLASSCFDVRTESVGIGFVSLHLIGRHPASVVGHFTRHAF